MSDRDDLFGRIGQLKVRESQRFREEMDRQTAALRAEKRLRDGDERLTRELLRGGGIDVGRIEEEEREQAENTRAFVEKLRAERLIGHETLADHYRRRTLAFEFGTVTGGHLLPPFTANVRASNEVLLDSITGTEEDDGTVTPDDPDVLDLAAKDDGEGVFGFFGHIIPIIQADVYYGFVPTETGTHQISPSIDFHGFYTVKADDKFWNSKSAEVRLNVEVGAEQYGRWQSWESTRVLRERKTNGTRSERLDETKSFTSKAELAKGDGVVVLVRISMTAAADGNGSFAEIDFAAGSANYIRPLTMTVQHL